MGELTLKDFFYEYRSILPALILENRGEEAATEVGQLKKKVKELTAELEVLQDAVKERDAANAKVEALERRMRESGDVKDAEIDSLTENLRLEKAGREEDNASWVVKVEHLSVPYEKQAERYAEERTRATMLVEDLLPRMKKALDNEMRALADLDRYEKLTEGGAQVALKIDDLEKQLANYAKEERERKTLLVKPEDAPICQVCKIQQVFMPAQARKVKELKHELSKSYMSGFVLTDRSVISRSSSRRARTPSPPRTARTDARHETSTESRRKQLTREEEAELLREALADAIHHASTPAILEYAAEEHRALILEAASRPTRLPPLTAWPKKPPWRG
jgi:hypothetical protein